ncbi:MAG: protein kinase [Armatimonadetes bacterium]|nr:protein kinase [Armatimonadota bacterium]
MPQEYLRLGELLVAKGIISNLQLSIALAAQQTSNRRLGEIVVERGFANERQIAECLAHQYGFELVDPAEVAPQPEALSVMDADFAVSACALPVRRAGGCLECLVADPVDVETTDRIARLASTRVRLKVAPRTALLAAIRKAYGLDQEARSAAGASYPAPPGRFSQIRPRRAFGQIVLLDAWDDELNRAVSLLAVAEGGDQQRRQFDLVRAAARRSAHGICAVHDWFRHEDHWWASLESLRGETLENVLRTRGPRSVPQAAELVATVAEGVDELCKAAGHSGLVCPANVMILEGGRVVLAPFVKPPAEYQSPELASAGEADSRSDVFSLGTLLLETATGSNPFRRASEEETLESLRNPPEPGSLAVPPALAQILSRCFPADPDERFGSPVQVAVALRAYDWSAPLQRPSPDLGVATRDDRDQLLSSLTSESAPSGRTGFWRRLFGKRAA